MRNTINIIGIIRIILYISLILLFIIVPTQKFESKTICFLYNTFHILCPSCGTTRAFSSIMHLDIIKAITYNPVFALATCPICLFIFIQDGFTIIKRIFKKEKKYSFIEYFFLGVC